MAASATAEWVELRCRRHGWVGYTRVILTIAGESVAYIVPRKARPPMEDPTFIGILLQDAAMKWEELNG